MAATLASVCSVPLTSVLLLFELTKDYRILLPLMVSVNCQCTFSMFLLHNIQTQICLVIFITILYATDILVISFTS